MPEQNTCSVVSVYEDGHGTHGGISSNCFDLNTPVSSYRTDYIKNPHSEQYYKVQLRTYGFGKYQRKCLSHSMASWKEKPQLLATKRYAKGKEPIRMYSRDELDYHSSSGWMFCTRCRLSTCEDCVISTLARIEEHTSAKDKATIKNHAWYIIAHEFVNLTAPPGRYKFIVLDGTVSTCCNIGATARKERNRRKRDFRKTKKALLVGKLSKDEQLRVGILPNNYQEQIKVDGLLHYAPFRAVFHPSLKYYETLAVAQQGKKGDPNFQTPVYHSVIPNEIAWKYSIRQVQPTGQISSVVKEDAIYNIKVRCPINDNLVSFCVRRIVLRRCEEYKNPPPNGSCMLTDEEYFKSCVPLLDEKWERNDVANHIDIILVTGEPDVKDAGKNEILLCGRIYKKTYEMPKFGPNQLNKFFGFAFQMVGKGGFEVKRLGGSGGISMPSFELLQFFKQYRACFPNIAGGVANFALPGGRWKSVYISPYKGLIEDSASSVTYSNPRLGGAIGYQDEFESILPRFFEGMSLVRATMGRVLKSLYMVGVEISPYAMLEQLDYNDKAIDGGGTVRLKHRQRMNKLMRQVVYSFVPYTVGSHKDVTKNGVATELIECKGCLVWPGMSKDATMTNLPLGRGGAGNGVYTVMIVDHPQK